ncbi:MAG: hypothetical protein U5Q44_13855 [Dehalococcoidia bacterium]|nr:hypothetical protein [Dehalococcoidia bacterium]
MSFNPVAVYRLLHGLAARLVEREVDFEVAAFLNEPGDGVDVTEPGYAPCREVDVRMPLSRPRASEQ